MEQRMAHLRRLKGKRSLLDFRVRDLFSVVEGINGKARKGIQLGKGFKPGGDSSFVPRLPLPKP